MTCNMELTSTAPLSFASAVFSVSSGVATSGTVPLNLKFSHRFSFKVQWVKYLSIWNCLRQMIMILRTEFFFLFFLVDDTILDVSESF